MNNPSGNHKLRADVIVIVSLLVLALVLYLALNLGRREGGTAVVRVNGVRPDLLDQINTALQELIDDGVVDEIVGKYISAD